MREREGKAREGDARERRCENDVQFVRLMRIEVFLHVIFDLVRSISNNSQGRVDFIEPTSIITILRSMRFDPLSK